MMDIFQDKIDIIKREYEPRGIILIGSFVEKYNNYIKYREDISSKEVGDIDLFIIGDYINFERSVELHCGIEFDISYIGLDDLNKAVDEEIDSIITILAMSKILDSDEEIKNTIEDIKKLYMNGPKKVDNYFIDYKRFVLTNDLYQLKKSIERIEFDILFNNLIKDLIKFYYRVNGKWMPAEKRLLKFIEDSNILYILEEIYKTNNRNKKLESIEKLFNYIIKDFGGELKEWKKGPYPFDFK